jgi:hypothetical protein
MNKQTRKELAKIKTATDVKYHEPLKYFFSKETMRFFGDTMKSFGVRWINGKRVMYRKPSASVDVFGTWKTAGRAYFNAWVLTFDKDWNLKMESIHGEELDLIFAEV